MISLGLLVRKFIVTKTVLICLVLVLICLTYVCLVLFVDLQQSYTPLLHHEGKHLHLYHHHHQQQQQQQQHCQQHVSSSSSSSYCHYNDSSTVAQCIEYPETVDLRVIVLTLNRPRSLLKTLRSLDTLHTDGLRTTLDIWVDRSKLTGHVDTQTLRTARRFNWTRGPTHVYIQPQHAGIYGQWIDTWRPAVGGQELALILEDDIDVSPMALRWLRAVHDKLSALTDFVGTSLTSDQLSVLADGMASRDRLAAGHNETIFMYKCLGTWGFAPKPQRWRQFQDWFHTHKTAIGGHFRPYVPGVLPTRWYQGMEKSGTADTMWEMWFIYFMHTEQLYTVYNNLWEFTSNKKSCLSINRREVGLHVDIKGRQDYCSLLSVWSQEFIDFPQNVVRLDWDGSELRTRLY